MDNWYRFKDKKPEVLTESLLYSESYIDFDFCPDGVTFGFMYDNQSVLVSDWDNDADCWNSFTVYPEDKFYPTHWQPKPSPPKE